jgi:hypothetical protein
MTAGWDDGRVVRVCVSMYVGVYAFCVFNTPTNIHCAYTPFSGLLLTQHRAVYLHPGRHACERHRNHRRLRY